MTANVRKAFGLTCKWCNTLRLIVKGEILICPKCDMNSDTVIPNLED
jgi:hypothetical protein